MKTTTAQKPFRRHPAGKQGRARGRKFLATALTLNAWLGYVIYRNGGVSEWQLWLFAGISAVSIVSAIVVTGERQAGGPYQDDPYDIFTSTISKGVPGSIWGKPKK